MRSSATTRYDHGAAPSKARACSDVGRTQGAAIGISVPGLDVKKLAKRLLLSFPGFESICRRFTAGTVRTLMYHRFGDGATTDRRCVDSGVLRQQAFYLVRHHDLWLPDDILPANDGARPIGRCPVVVTVDDGYRDFYEVAYPIFREYRIPVMLFLTTGFVDGNVWFWWDRLECILDGLSGSGEFEAEVGGHVLHLDPDTPEGRASAWQAVANRCRFLPDEQKEAVLEALASRLKSPLGMELEPRYRAVTWDQVRRMAADGVRFGVHTVSHPILARVTTERARREITDARVRLGEVLGSMPEWFCYPQGGPADVTRRERDLVAEAGHRGAFVAYQNLLTPEDAYALPRSGVSADMTEFRWTLCGAEILVLRLRRRLGMDFGPGSEYWVGSS